MLEHVKTGDIVYFVANFHNFVGGYSINSQDPPQWLVYENNGTTSILGGAMTKRTNITGSYVGSFSATLANGLDPNNFYDVQVSGKINKSPAFISVKQFVLDEIIPTNTVQVSGKPVSIADFNVGGVGGGTATLANQNVIINHLTDIKGVSWSATTDSLEQLQELVSDGYVSISNDLNGILNANLVQINGSGVQPVLVVDANIIQVSGKPVSLSDFNVGGDEGASIVNANLIQVSGVNTSLGHITNAVWNELIKEH